MLLRAPRLLALAALLSVAATVPAQDFGPIKTRNHRVPSLQFLRFYPGERALAPGKKLLDIGWHQANDFRDVSEGGRRVVEDLEVTRFNFGYREGTNSGWTWGVDVPVMSYGGGFLDPIIDWWHANVLHWSDPQRDNAPFGRTVVQGPGYGPFGSATGIGDASFVASKACGRFVLTGGIKLPTGDAGKLMGSGNFDAGISASGRWGFGRKFGIEAQLGLVAQGQADVLPGNRSFVHQEMIALSWQPNSRDAWTVQWQGEASAQRLDIGPSDATHRLVTFGYQRRLSDRQMLELLFSEDRDLFSGAWPEGANIGPDFTIGARLILRY